MVIKFIPQKRAIHVGTTGCPGISGTGRFSLWSTGGPLHDYLLTSQAASGKDSGGIEKLLCRFESLWGYRWELWSGLSKAEFPLRLSKVLVAFINRSAVSPEAKSRDTQSKGSHEDMTKSYWPLIWAKLLWDQICTCCLGQRTYGGFGLHILTGQPQCTLKHGQLKTSVLVIHACMWKWLHLLNTHLFHWWGLQIELRLLAAQWISIFPWRKSLLIHRKHRLQLIYCVYSLLKLSRKLLLWFVL